MNVISQKQALRRIGKNVAYAMARNGLTIRGLADAIKETHTGIHRIMRGTNEPRITLVARVADHLGVTIDDLLLPPPEFRRRLSERSAPSRKNSYSLI